MGKPITIWLALQCIAVFSFGQKLNGEIFIPMNDRTEIWLRPKLDTLTNKFEYEFKIRVSAEYKVSQFLFEKGLAIQNDSVLKIVPNSPKTTGVDTAVLRVIVTSIKGSRTYLFQKKFIIIVPEKIFPIEGGSRSTIVRLNDRTTMERNKPYPKDLFLGKPYFTMYASNNTDNKMQVSNVTFSLHEKEGKQFVSNGDTLTSDAVKEIHKIKNPTPVYIKVDGQLGKVRKSVWSRIVIYND